jgi:hypothetical protein
MKNFILSLEWGAAAVRDPMGRRPARAECHAGQDRPHSQYRILFSFLGGAWVI